MRQGLALVVVGLLGCSPSSADEKPAVSPEQADPEVKPEPEPEPEPEAQTNIVVLLTAATLADDCGGAPNTKPSRSRPAPQPASKGKSKLKRDRGPDAKGKRAKRRCKQSSIQLSIAAPKDASAAKIEVKSVELLLASGESIGMLQTRAPSVWSAPDGYAPWDENVKPGDDLSVSYAVTSPEWNQVKDRRSQTYTVEAVVSVAGADQTLKQNVVVDVPASLPPNVKT